MKLKKFRVRNYKSIKDTGDCWLASDLTILAGKNESGKTAILEALRDFDTSIESISDSAWPLDDIGRPEVELCFEISEPILNEIESALGIDLGKTTKDYIRTNGLSIIKDHEGCYSLSHDIKGMINKEKREGDQATDNEMVEAEVLKELADIFLDELRQ
ncbi:MAG: AAA family ATPase, partial [Actinomycetota bacterium]|nr:AAA family ATPase [Actinomycetota bacterium]